MLKLLAKLTVWNLLPNGRRRHLLQPLGGPPLPPRRASARSCARTSRQVFELVRDGAITPQIAARFPLDQAADALRFAEAGGFTGKVLLVP